MNGRQIHDIEAELREARKRIRSAPEGAVHVRVRGLGAREELVPARETRLAPLDVEWERLVLGGEGAAARISDDSGR